MVVADVAALLPSFATFFCFTEGQKLKTMKTTPLLVAVSCKALPMAKATEGCPPGLAVVFCSGMVKCSDFLSFFLLFFVA